jgi:hypothetical protein
MHAGIRVGEEGFYDPSKGLQKLRTPRPEPEATPVLATDPGQPTEGYRAVVGRSKSIDKSTIGMVGSKPTGRKKRVANVNTETSTGSE